MDWVWLFIIILSCLIFLLLLGVPVAFAFLSVSILFFIYFLGCRYWVDPAHFKHLSIRCVIFPASITPISFNGRDHVPLRDCSKYDGDIGEMDGAVTWEVNFVAVVGGVIFATLSGSSMAGCAMLGQTLLPEMEKRGYKHQINLGPIMGCGTLAAMIPPSALGVLLACLAQDFCGRFSSFHHRSRSFNGCFICCLHHHSVYFTAESCSSI